MLSATVFKLRDVLYLHSESKTTDGVWIASGPFLKITNSKSVLGEAALTVLQASKTSIPHPKPEEWGGIIAPVLQLAGVKSWSKFVKDASSADLKVEGDRLKIIPNRNLGHKDGFEPIREKAIELPFPCSSHEIGAAVDEALARCE
jgi:hypothetical protein